MEYYIVRIYYREPCRIEDGNLRQIRITGLVENQSGRKELFHDAETLARLLAQGGAVSKPPAPENNG